MINGSHLENKEYHCERHRGTLKKHKLFKIEQNKRKIIVEILKTKVRKFRRDKGIRF